MGQMSQMGPMYLMYQLFYETWLKGSNHRYKLSLFLLGVYIRAEGAMMKVNKILTIVVAAAFMTPVRLRSGLAS